MKTRMASARCCCGGSGIPQCDPPTGKLDEFDFFDYDRNNTVRGKWWQSFATTESYQPTIENGKLIIDGQQDPNINIFGTHFLERCANWSADVHGGLWPRTSGLQYRLRFNWRPPNGVPLSYGIDRRIMGLYVSLSHLRFIDQLWEAWLSLDYDLNTQEWRLVVESSFLDYYEPSPRPNPSIFRTAPHVIAVGTPQNVNVPLQRLELIMNIAPLPSQNWFQYVTLHKPNVWLTPETMCNYPEGICNRPYDGTREFQTFLHGMYLYTAAGRFELDRWQYM